jgi:group II intron reverse transcriptase/maturase
MAMDLSHHIDREWLVEAYRRTRKDGAVGVDGVTGAQYGETLDAHIGDLIERAKSGCYRAPPVKRVLIPKGDGKERRPIGIPAFEDKLLQRAIEMLLTPVFEQDFYDFSYGFRPGRSAHQALQALWDGLMRLRGGTLIDLDIRSYFDSVDPKYVQHILRQRVRDGVVRRLIGKWLKAGVLENDRLRYEETGVPQGGVISPLISNIYLHEVLDTWFVDEVKPRMKGRAFMIRYADDAVLVFEHREDAERVYAVIDKRFARFGLTLHPDKTRLIEFRPGPRRGGSSFDFLGFSHLWGTSRKGKPVVKRKTAKKRFARALKSMNQWLRRVRHLPITEQHRVLRQKLQGHFGYYGITGNGKALSAFVYRAMHMWFKWLRRRSYKARRTWEWYRGLLKRFPLPRPTPVHSVLRRGYQSNLPVAVS